MHFETTGSGPPILLLHAFPLDGRMWGDQVSDLSADHLMLVPDMPGFGSSTRAEGKPALEDWARQVIAGCKHFGVERALVAGCSMGGYLAFAMHRLAPEFASGYAFIDTRARPDTQDARRTRYEMVERARHEGTGFLLNVDPPVSARTKRDLPDAMALIRTMTSDATPVGVMAAQRAMASRKDAQATAASIGVPCAVLYGSDDPLIPRADAEALAHAISGATFIEIPGAGHLPPIEAPATVTAALRSLAAIIESM